MPLKPATLCAAFLLMAVPAFAVAAGQWQAYVNERFGVQADVPAGWTANPPPENGDGQRWTSPDGKAEVAVWGGFQIEDSVEDAFATVGKADDDELVTYRVRGKQSLVLSGVKGDNIFYKRLLLSCKGTVWNGVEITYPKAQKAAFDSIVSHIAGSLKPGKGYNNDKCG